MDLFKQFAIVLELSQALISQARGLVDANGDRLRLNDPLDDVPDGDLSARLSVQVALQGPSDLRGFLAFVAG